MEETELGFLFFAATLATHAHTQSNTNKNLGDALIGGTYAALMGYGEVSAGKKKGDSTEKEGDLLRQVLMVVFLLA